MEEEVGTRRGMGEEVGEEEVGEIRGVDLLSLLGEKRWGVWWKGRGIRKEQ